MKALLSVSDKRELADFAAKLTELGFEILATEGTANYLEARGIQVTRLSEVTGIEETRGLKTLHPTIYRWIFDGELRVVAVIPYDFSNDPRIENIDVGGISLLRAAAKNYAKVFVAFRPEHYGYVLEGLRNDSLELRRRLAVEAFRFTSRYDSLVAEWLENEAP